MRWYLETVYGYSYIVFRKLCQRVKTTVWTGMQRKPVLEERGVVEYYFNLAKVCYFCLCHRTLTVKGVSLLFILHLLNYEKLFHVARLRHLICPLRVE